MTSAGSGISPTRPVRKGPTGWELQFHVGENGREIGGLENEGSAMSA